MFYHNLKNIWSDNAVINQNGRWYIDFGFCGYNSAANNKNGYASKEKAEAAILRYQNKSEYIKTLSKDIKNV